MLGRCEANCPTVHDLTFTPYDYLVEPTGRYLIYESTNPNIGSVQRRVDRDRIRLRTVKRINNRTKIFRDGSKDGTPPSSMNAADVCQPQAAWS
jgi:hypothetical protein